MLDSLKLEGNKQLESIKMKDSELGVLKDTLMQKEDQLDRFRSEHERIGREVLIAVRTKLFLVGETARGSRLMADVAAMQLLIEVLATIS